MEERTLYLEQKRNKVTSNMLMAKRGILQQLKTMTIVMSIAAMLLSRVILELRLVLMLLLVDLVRTQ